MFRIWLLRSGLVGISLLLAIGVASCRRRVPVQEISAPSGLPNVEAYVPNESDWPGWRGPFGNGLAVSETAPVRWSTTQNVVWSAPVPGRGHASPVVCDDFVLLATAIEAAEQQLVVAYDRSSGTELWRTELNQGGFPPDRQMHPKGSHANSTVACDDQFIYAAFLNHDAITLSAIDLEGNIGWQTQVGAFQSKFGFAPSPVLYKSLVLLAADNSGGGYLVAVHRRTGEIVWRKARSKVSTYSTAMVAHVAGRDQLLITGNEQVCSYDPATGDPLWRCAGTAEATCGTVVWNDSLVFASGGYPERETLAVKADGSAEVVWRNRVKNYEPSLLLVGDELYATTDNGIAYCWDAATGQLNWKARLGGAFSASPVFCGGHVYASNSSGVTFVFRATSSEYDLVSENVLGDDAYASPAICDEQIYLRVGHQRSAGREERIYCIGNSEPTTTN